MKMRDWTFLLIIVSIIIIVSNFVGYDVAMMESIPGVLILAAITLIGYGASKVIPLKMPMILYVSLIGLIVACPISPVSDFVIEQTGKISFMAPVTAVGAFAGIAMGKDLKAFKEQSWKMVLIGIVVFTGTFFGSAIVAQIVLKLTNAI
ncbi:hypothetical protein GCM10011409_15800 [Lentibacillus populi]|uniref:DUF340 domain-containing protein n=1 Tax=Lentibacillus populi TaxID=1827502 RepID=A0A9W5TWX4_9BACI|nr:hypothetical protein [Lentibacillus populi]GGB39102.1 hypothetical protein GCM10011409_15800 [Lentibacillus populi]